MEKYVVAGENGVMVTANFAELFRIARIWIDKMNETAEKGDKWSYPENERDVKEILEEYMGCDICYSLDDFDLTVEEKYHNLMS